MKTVTWNGKLHRERTPDNSPRRMGTEDCAYMFETFLSTYFLDATSHHTGNNTPFTANFYHQSEFPAYGTTLILPGGPEAGGAFREHRSSHPDRLSGSPNIRLEYRSWFIGVLCPETQTLWATDWTHAANISYRNTTRHIINYLAEQGLIHPVPVKATEPKKKKEEPQPKKTEFVITIGGDPEFELVDNHGQVLRAGDEYRFEIHETCGEVGLDGSCDQVELRPSPGKPQEVVENVRKLLEIFGRDHSHRYRLAASSDEFPCGGHIHIGVRPLPDNTYFEKLSNILDDFIGRPTRKLNGVCRGESSSYGNTGDWRNQGHGMEYRTPPSAVWKSPAITKVVLKLVYNLAQTLADNLQLEYENPTSIEDLVYIGKLLPEEAAFYLEECQKQAPHADECLLAAWGVKVEPIKPPKPQIHVEFSEDWNSEVKRLLTRYLKNVVINKNITITCYGLKESRGDVFTFEMPGKAVVEHPQSGGLSATHFGFSKKFRRGSISSPDIYNAGTSISKVIMGIQDGTIPLNPRRGSESDDTGWDPAREESLEEVDLESLARALEV